ncbi:MAG: hypothetical protein OHK0039_08710 [Bacteroidia bacterium]
MDHILANYQVPTQLIEDAHKFTESETRLARGVAKQRIAQLDWTADPDSWTRAAAPAIRLLAWQYYYDHNYQQALAQLDRLIAAGVGDAEVYYLKGHICRVLYDSPEANLRTLDYLERADSLSHTHYLEIAMEKGLLLLRMNRYTEALVAFTVYRDMLIASQADPETRRWAERMILLCERSEAWQPAKPKVPVQDRDSAD